MSYDIDSSKEIPNIRVQLTMGLSEAEDLLSLIDVGRQVYSSEALTYADAIASVLQETIERCKKQEEFYARL
jgi:hypothetical protein